MMTPVFIVQGGRHFVEAAFATGHGRDVSTGRLGGAGVAVGGRAEVRDEGPDLLTLSTQPSQYVALP